VSQMASTAPLRRLHTPWRRTHHGRCCFPTLSPSRMSRMSMLMSGGYGVKQSFSDTTASIGEPWQIYMTNAGKIQR
jgi:hypothetical protein